MADPRQEILNRLILVQCRQGKKEGLETLVNEWQKPLFYYIRRLVEREEEAWDAMQDTWLRIFRGIRSVRSAEALPTWLYRVARNVVISRRRDDIRRQDRQDASSEEELAALADPGPLPSDLSAKTLHESLDRLSVPEREVLALHFLEGYKVQEIAEITGEPAGTVKSRLFRAKRNLRSILEEEGFEA